MTEEIITTTSAIKIRTKKEEELIRLSKQMSTILESERGFDTKDIYIIINKISNILGPSYDSIPGDTRKLLGAAYISALSETDNIDKSTHVRTTLSLLRGAIVAARGPKIQIKMIDSYIYMFEQEMTRISQQGEEAMYDKLWALTNRALDYLAMMVPRGYGEINSSKGFNFTRSTDTTVNKGGTK